MFLLWHPWLTTTNLSYSFPLLETSATALCGTTGNYKRFRCAQRDGCVSKIGETCWQITNCGWISGSLSTFHGKCIDCRKATATRESLIDYNICRLASSLVLLNSLLLVLGHDHSSVSMKAHIVTLRRVFCWLAPWHCLVAHCVSLFIDHDVHRPRNYMTSYDIFSVLWGSTRSPGWNIRRSDPQFHSSWLGLALRFTY